jgi:flagellar hook-associated protein 3 FlgL
MRVTPTIQDRNFLEDVNRLRSRQQKSQEEVSSGKTVNRLSDNPFAAAQSSNIMSAISANDQFTAANGQVRSQLELTDYALQSLNSSIDAAKNLAAQALAGTTTADSRQALATGVDGIRQQVLSLSNTKFNGTFLFAGTQTTTAPFVDTGGTVTYQGNDEAVYQRLDRTSVVKTNVTGQELFVDSPSVFSVLDDLKTAILANDTATIKSRLNDLDTVSSRVNTTDAIVGSNMQLVDQVQSVLSDQSQALQQQDSNLTDANLAESISNLNLTSQALDVALNAQARIQQLSLLDYLR